VPAPIFTKESPKQLQDTSGREPSPAARHISGSKLLDISGSETLPTLELLDTSGPEVFGQVQP
jgi:hypothetical protein